MIEALYGKFADTITGRTVFAYQCKVCANWESMSEPHKVDCPVPGIESERERLINLSVAFESQIADMSLGSYRDANAVRFIPDLGYPDGDGSEFQDAVQP